MRCQQPEKTGTPVPKPILTSQCRQRFFIRKKKECRTKKSRKGELEKFSTSRPAQSIFKKYFIYLFLERGEGREKEKERNSDVWLPLVHPLLGT